MILRASLRAGLALLLLLLSGGANALIADVIYVSIDPGGGTGPDSDEWLFIWDDAGIAPVGTKWSVTGTFSNGGATFNATEQVYSGGGNYISLKGADPFTIGSTLNVSYPPAGNAQTWLIPNKKTTSLTAFYSIAETPTPEPGFPAPLAAGLLGMALAARKRFSGGIGAGMRPSSEGTNVTWRK